MAILHITTGSNYNVTIPFVKFVNQNFDLNKHKFLIVDDQNNVPSELLKYSNTIVLDVKSKLNFGKMLYYIKNNEVILLHSLFCFSNYQLFYLLFYRRLFSKMVWIAWGADLYQWRKVKNRNIYDKVRNIVASSFRKKIKYFVGIFPPDIDFFKKGFKSNAKTFYASYVGSMYNPLFEKENLPTLGGKVKNEGCINIQIGHSATPILNHIPVLNALHKFKSENIKIHIPLSYGDMEYGNQVEQHAKALFGDKVLCIREMMSKEDYMDFLSTVDIAIFNTPRQIGLGNITPLLYMEKKIFIPGGTVMYEYYKSQNIEVCNYNQIDEIEFDKLSKPVDMKNAKQFVKSHYINKEKNIERWQKIFNLSIK